MYRMKLAALLASLRLYKISAILLSAGLSGTLSADEQIVSSEVIAGSGGADIMLVLRYQTIPENQQTTGLGVSVYFDSTQLDFISMSADSAVADSLIGITSLPGHIADDSDDNDADASTDKVATIAFTSFNGRFPPSTTWTGMADGVVIATPQFLGQPYQLLRPTGLTRDIFLLCNDICTLRAALSANRLGNVSVHFPAG